jgi:hypothetical protein
MIKVSVRKIDGEWVALVIVNGKRDEGKSYYTNGSSDDHKEDAIITARMMRETLSPAIRI